MCQTGYVSLFSDEQVFRSKECVKLATYFYLASSALFYLVIFSVSGISSVSPTRYHIFGILSCFPARFECDRSASSAFVALLSVVLNRRILSRS